MTAFETFWSRYPRKVGRLAAEAAYRKALTLASAEDILAGLERYRLHMPDEIKFTPHPTTWLHQGRWLDEYDEPVMAQPTTASDWGQECAECHGGTCRKRWDHATRMAQERAS